MDECFFINCSKSLYNLLRNKVIAHNENGGSRTNIEELRRLFVKNSSKGMRYAVAYINAFLMLKSDNGARQKYFAKIHHQLTQSNGTIEVDLCIEPSENDLIAAEKELISAQLDKVAPESLYFHEEKQVTIWNSLI